MKNLPKENLQENETYNIFVNNEENMQYNNESQLFYEDVDDNSFQKDVSIDKYINTTH